MQLNKTVLTDESDAIDHHDQYNAFEIKVRQCGRVHSTESVIWPWAFPKELKEYLICQGEIIYLEAGSVLVLDNNPKQLIVLLQGAIKVCKYVSKHKHSILEFYLSCDSFEYSNEENLNTKITHEVIQSSFIYVGPTNFEVCTNKQKSEFTRLILHKREQKIRTLQSHLSVMATFNAQEKVAYFIVDMYRRLALRNCIHLPMSRVDISHYLSLTPETVSRELNRFNQLGYLKLHRADIEFKRIDSLIKLYS